MKFIILKSWKNKILSSNPDFIWVREYSHFHFEWNTERCRIRIKYKTRKNHAIHKLQKSKQYLNLKESNQARILEKLII